MTQVGKKLSPMSQQIVLIVMMITEPGGRSAKILKSYFLTLNLEDHLKDSPSGFDPRSLLCYLQIEIYEDHLVATQACADFDQLVAGNLSLNITSGQSLPVCHRFYMTVLYLNFDDQHILKLHPDDQLGLQGDVFALPASNAGNPLAGHNIVQLQPDALLASKIFHQSKK